MKLRPLFPLIICIAFFVAPFSYVRGQQVFGKLAYMAQLYDPTPLKDLANDKMYRSYMLSNRNNDKPDNLEFMLVCHWKDMCLAKKSDRPAQYLVRKRDILTLDLPNQAPILNPDPQLLSLHLPSCESISPSISTQSASSRLSLSKQPITPSRKSYLGKTRGATQFAYHMVEAGESLYSISVLSGITIEELQDLNDQPLDDLYVGKEIRVPATFGGTVYSSRRFTLPEKEKRYLDFDSDPSLLHTVYRVGGTPPNNQRASSQHMGSQNFLHNARRGETVISISLKYDISPIELMKANQLRDLDGIVEGQLLEIPR